jgi:hypothetical protein
MIEERCLYRLFDLIADGLLFGEPNLALARVNVDVDFRAREVAVQDGERIPAGTELFVVGVDDCITDGLRTHEPPVDVRSEVVRTGAGGLGVADDARKVVERAVGHGVVGDGKHRLGDLAAVHRERGRFEIVLPGSGERFSVVVFERHRDIRIGERVPGSDIVDVGEFGRFRAEVLPARGHVVEQVVDFDTGTLGTACRFD